MENNGNFSPFLHIRCQCLCSETRRSLRCILFLGFSVYSDSRHLQVAVFRLPSVQEQVALNCLFSLSQGWNVKKEKCCWHNNMLLCKLGILLVSSILLEVSSMCCKSLSSLSGALVFRNLQTWATVGTVKLLSSEKSPCACHRESPVSLLSLPLSLQPWPVSSVSRLFLYALP